MNRRVSWARVKPRVHMSRTQFKQLGSIEVRRLTQLSLTDFIWSG